MSLLCGSAEYPFLLCFVNLLCRTWQEDHKATEQVCLSTTYDLNDRINVSSTRWALSSTVAGDLYVHPQLITNTEKIIQHTINGDSRMTNNFGSKPHFRRKGGKRLSKLKFMKNFKAMQRVSNINDANTPEFCCNPSAIKMHEMLWHSMHQTPNTDSTDNIISSSLKNNCQSIFSCTCQHDICQRRVKGSKQFAVSSIGIKNKKHNIRRLLEEGTVNTDIIKDLSVLSNIYNNKEVTHYMELLQLLNTNNELSTQREYPSIPVLQLQATTQSVTAQTVSGKNINIHTSQLTDKDITTEETYDDIEHFYDDEYATHYDTPYDEYENEDYVEGTTIEFYDYEEEASTWKQETIQTTRILTVGQDIDIFGQTIPYDIGTESKLLVSTEISIRFSSISTKHDLGTTEIMKSYETKGMHSTENLLTELSIKDDTLKIPSFESVITMASTTPFAEESTISLYLEFSTSEFRTTFRKPQDTSTSTITLMETETAMGKATKTSVVPVEEKYTTYLYSITESKYISKTEITLPTSYYVFDTSSKTSVSASTIITSSIVTEIEIEFSETTPSIPFTAMETFSTMLTLRESSPTYERETKVTEPLGILITDVYKNLSTHYSIDIEGISEVETKSLRVSPVTVSPDVISTIGIDLFSYPGFSISSVKAVTSSDMLTSEIIEQLEIGKTDTTFRELTSTTSIITTSAFPITHTTVYTIEPLVTESQIVFLSEIPENVSTFNGIDIATVYETETSLSVEVSLMVITTGTVIQDTTSYHMSIITSSVTSTSTTSLSMFTETRLIDKQTTSATTIISTTTPPFTSPHVTVHFAKSEMFTSMEPFKTKFVPLLEVTTQWINFTEIYDEETTFSTALPVVTISSVLTSTEIQVAQNEITVPTETKFLLSMFATRTTYEYKKTEVMETLVISPTDIWEVTPLSISTDSTEMSESESSSAGTLVFVTAILTEMFDQETVALEITTVSTVLSTIEATSSTSAKTELTESQITLSIETEFISSQYRTAPTHVYEKTRTATSVATSTSTWKSVTAFTVTDRTETETQMISITETESVSSQFITESSYVYEETIRTTMSTATSTSIWGGITTSVVTDSTDVSEVETLAEEVSTYITAELTKIIHQEATSYLEVTLFSTALPMIITTAVLTSVELEVTEEVTESQIKSFTETDFLPSQFTTASTHLYEETELVETSVIFSTNLWENITIVVADTLEVSETESTTTELWIAATTNLTETSDRETALYSETTTFYSTYPEFITSHTTLSEIEVTETRITLPLETEFSTSTYIEENVTAFTGTLSKKINETDTSAAEILSLVTSSFTETFRQGTMLLTTEKTSAMASETVSTLVSLILSTLRMPYLTFTESSFQPYTLQTVTEKSVTISEETEDSSYEDVHQYYDEEIKDDYEEDYEEEETTESAVTEFYDYEEATSKKEEEEETELLITISTRLESLYETRSMLPTFVAETKILTTSLLEKKSTLTPVLSTESYQSSSTSVTSVLEDTYSTSVSVEKSTDITDSSEVFITETEPSSSLELSTLTSERTALKLSTDTTAVQTTAVVSPTESTIVEVPSKISMTVTGTEVIFSSVDQDNTTYSAEAFTTHLPLTSIVETSKTEPSLTEIFTFPTTMASDEIRSLVDLNISSSSIETTSMMTIDIFVLTTSSGIKLSEYVWESGAITLMSTTTMSEASFSLPSALHVDSTTPQTLLTEFMIIGTDLKLSTSELFSEERISTTASYTSTEKVQTTASDIEKTERLLKTSESVIPLVTDYQLEKTSFKSEHYTTQEEKTTFEYFYDQDYATDYTEAYEEGDYEDKSDVGVSAWYDYVDEVSEESSTTFLIKTTTSMFIETKSTTFTTKTFAAETLLTFASELNISSAEMKFTAEHKIPEEIILTTTALTSEVFGTEISKEAINISTDFYEQITTMEYSSLKYSTVTFTTYEFEENKTIGEFSLSVYITTPTVIETAYSAETKLDLFYSTQLDITLYTTAAITEIKLLDVLPETIFTTLSLLEMSTEQITPMSELSIETFEFTTSKSIFDTLLSPVTVENISLSEILSTTPGTSLFTTEKLINQSSTITVKKEEEEKITEQLIEQLNEVESNEQILAQREDELGEEEHRWRDEKRKRIAEIRSQKMQQMQASIESSLDDIEEDQMLMSTNAINVADIKTDILDVIDAFTISASFSEITYSTKPLYGIATPEFLTSTFTPVLVPPTIFDYIAPTTSHATVESDFSDNIKTLEKELKDRTRRLNDREARILERERLLEEDKERFENKVREIMENGEDFQMEDLEQLEEEIKHKEQLEYITRKQTTFHTFSHENVTFLYQSTLFLTTEEYTAIVEPTHTTSTTSIESGKRKTTDKKLTTRICLNVLKDEVPFPARNANALMIKEVCLPMFSLDKNTLQLPHNATSKFSSEITIKGKIKPADRIYRIKDLRLKNNEWAEPTLPSKGHKLAKFVRFYEKLFNVPSKSVTATSAMNKRNVDVPTTKNYGDRIINNFKNVSWITRSSQIEKMGSIQNIKFTASDSLVQDKYKLIDHERNDHKSNIAPRTNSRFITPIKIPWDYKKMYQYRYNTAKQAMKSRKSKDRPERKRVKIVQDKTNAIKLQQKKIAAIKRNIYVTGNTFHSLDNNKKAYTVKSKKSKNAISVQARGRLDSTHNDKKYFQRQKNEKASKNSNFVPLPYDFRRKRNNLKEEIETWPTEKVTRHHVGGTRFWKSELIGTENWNDEKQNRFAEEDNLQDVVTGTTCLYVIFTSESTQNERP